METIGTIEMINMCVYKKKQTILLLGAAQLFDDQSWIDKQRIVHSFINYLLRFS